MENEWNDLINEECEDTPMLKRLRSHLSSISADQFQTEWAEIEAMGFEVLIDEEKLIMNANDGAMDQMVQNAMKIDPLPIVY